MPRLLEHIETLAGLLRETRGDVPHWKKTLLAEIDAALEE